VTQIINLYGGPGTGKSTTAAMLFALLKQQGINAELVQEYVKGWAWEGRSIQPLDQYYFLGKQMRREATLLGKVDVIVTDSPLLLGVHFSRYFGSADIARDLLQTIRTYWRRTEAEHRHTHVMLRRTKKYNPAGRYQTAEEARSMDGMIGGLLYEVGVTTYSGLTDDVPAIWEAVKP
jgi:hypothetical protein